MLHQYTTPYSSLAWLPLIGHLIYIGLVMTITKEQWRDGRRIGARDAFGVPSLALFSTMVGFGAVARENGFDAVQAVLTTALVWGMPGQVAFAQLFGAGGGAFVIFIAVALANLRMLPMTVSGLPTMRIDLHKVGVLRRLVAAHFMAVTGWAQLTLASQKVQSGQIYPYYLGFVAVIYMSALFGTGVGFFLADQAPRPVVMVAVYMTPLYILLLVSSARQVTNRQAVLLGAILGPLTYPLLGDWCLLAAGAGGGALALIKRKALDRKKAQ